MGGGKDKKKVLDVVEQSTAAKADISEHYRYEKLGAVFDRLDVGKNGSISFAEFLTQVETLTPDEVEAARYTFDLLGPDKDGNVRRRKYIELQIEAFSDILDPEFDRWYNIMTTNSVVHAHKRKDLEAAGVEIPEDFVDPPSNNILNQLANSVLSRVKRVQTFLMEGHTKRRVAAYENSASARLKHIKRIQHLRAKLDSHDKTLLDEEHRLAIELLQEKAKRTGTQAPPLEREITTREERKRKVKTKRKPKRLQQTFASELREEKQQDNVRKRGLKAGCEPAPLLYESSDWRLKESHQIMQDWLQHRLGEDLVQQDEYISSEDEDEELGPVLAGDEVEATDEMSAKQDLMNQGFDDF
mmetsp:Transcript_44961/g.71830  ORF Transcript_44961/g.71830 Transcript_44961/m.71830 type:complete len:357 (-) Transcript_44961:47-1117(-)